MGPQTSDRDSRRQSDSGQSGPRSNDRGVDVCAFDAVVGDRPDEALRVLDHPDAAVVELAEDHANAYRLAMALSSMDGIVSAGGITQPGSGPLDPARVHTNFVLFGVGDDDAWPDDVAGRERVHRTRAAFLAELHDRGVRMIEYPKGLIRAIPHYGIERADIDAAIAASRAALAAIGLAPAISA